MKRSAVYPGAVDGFTMCSVFGTLSLIEIAAVLGADVDLGLLAAVTGRDALEILDELALDTSAIDVEGTRARFVGAARTQILAAVPPSRRAHIEAAAVRVLMSGDPAAEVLGRHLDAAGSALPDRERAEALVALGESLLRERDIASAREAFMRAAAAARTSGHAVALAHAALGLGTGQVGFEVQAVDRAQLDLLDEALDALGGDHAKLTALLTARKSIALTFVSPAPERVDLARAALSAAPDPATRASALAALCDAQAGPAHHSVRLEMTTEIVMLAHQAADHRLELLGHRMLLVAQAEAGNFAAVDHTVRDYAALVSTMREPLYAWYVPLWRAARAVLDGRLDDCRRLLDTATRQGAAVGSHNSYLLTHTLRWYLDPVTGNVAAIRALLAELSDDNDLWALIVKANINAHTGHLDDARSLMDAIMPRLRGLPVDSEWITSLAQVAETAALIGGHPCADWIYDQLMPYCEQWVIEGILAATRGSVHLFLGLAARAKGDEDAAKGHFTEALGRHVAAGAPLLAGHARAGLDTPAPQVTGGGNMRRDGDVWHIGFDGTERSVRHVKGLSDLTVLLRRPNQPVSALDLITAGAPHSQGLGPTLDEQAKYAYRRRLDDLNRILADADDRGDAAASQAATAERDALIAELSGAFGIGGRARPKGDAAEKARTAVTARIRDAIRRIENVHPALGRHLRLSIRTGITCSYEPERPVRWDLTS